MATQPVETKSVEIVNQNILALETILTESQDRLAVNLQGAIDPAKFLHVALELVRGTPGLLRCAETTEGKISILKGILEASEMGLLLTKNLGHGYLVPFKNGQLSERLDRDVYEAQFMIGYRGFLELVRNADSEVQTVYSRIVWPGEQFMLDESTHQLIHNPNPEGGQIHVNQQTGETGGYVGAYSKIIFKSGQQDFEWMPLHEIEKIRRASKAKSVDAPWRQWPEEMVKKTPMRRLCKRLKLTPERIAGVVRDEYRALGVEDGQAQERPSVQMPRRLSQAQAAPVAAAPPVQQQEQQQSTDHTQCCFPPECPICKELMRFVAQSKHGAFWSCPKYDNAAHKKAKAAGQKYTINAGEWHENENNRRPAAVTNATEAPAEPGSNG